ncbi:MAG: glycosyltransferase family 2 protein [Bacteroidales bacterium]|nr:glycosyltransferase family 2 protein [Bacteroidales bacterium]
MKISVVIITKNEERNILRCLNSVQDVADEIVVVDSGSTDDTAAICEQFGVKFVHQDWLGYSEQKNFANSLATNDWVLSIDADEELSDELKQSIFKYKNQHMPHDIVFSMNRLTNYCGHWIRHCGWYPDRKIRIWNRTVGQWQGEIHETLEFSTKVREKVLKGDLLHYSFETAQDYENQQFKFAKMRGQHYFMKGKKHASFYMVVSPIFSFIQHYFFQLGFLDGADGWHICLTTAKATRMKYKTLKELTDKKL